MVIEFVEGGVEGGGFPGAGGSGDEDDAVGSVDELDELVLDGGGEANGIEVDVAVALVEEPEDDAFAGGGGDDGTSDVHFGGGDFDAALSVLGESSLGDV